MYVQRVVQVEPRELMNSKTVLIADEDEDWRVRLGEALSGERYRVIDTADATQVPAILERETIHVVVAALKGRGLDGISLLRRLRRRGGLLAPVLLTSHATGIGVAVEAMREGAADFVLKTAGTEAVVEAIRRLIGVMPDSATVDLIAKDPKSLQLLSLAAKVAASEATVMLNGESGVGKEVYARFIHAHSSRCDGPFVAINCAAIPENMLEAVLFGHERGAFTGAYEARAGKFEQAQGGTLLLDEVSEMDMGLQAKLLRVLQEREVERLGGRRVISLDVRVLATSNRNLRQSVESGHLREDLYYRLNVFPLWIPPLRERPDDILPLAQRMIELHARGTRQPQLTSSAMARLLDHPWPGNVRELDNVIQRALILAPGERLDAGVIRFEPMGNEPAAVISAFNELDDPASDFDHDEDDDDLPGYLDMDLRSREERLILEALRAESGKRKEAAARLGISPRTLRYKLARLREAGVAIPG